jgi:hypothetical protein
LLNVGLGNGTKANERNVCVCVWSRYMHFHINFNFDSIYYISLECCFVILVLVNYWMIWMSQWPMGRHLLLQFTHFPTFHSLILFMPNFAKMVFCSYWLWHL